MMVDYRNHANENPKQLYYGSSYAIVSVKLILEMFQT